MRLSMFVMVVLAASVVSATAPGKPPILSRMTIRAYNSSGVESKVLERAQRISDDIVSDAGVESTWRTCRMASGPASSSRDDCRDQLADYEVIVRIVRAPEGIRGPDAPFGYSLVNIESRRGTLATVFADRIAAAADRVRLDRSALLGRAMAHELGHLLLGRTDHSTEGLMRAVWPDRALLSRTDADWRFSPIDLARLRVVFSFPNSASSPPLR
jgi:hypothetical protein